MAKKAPQTSILSLSGYHITNERTEHKLEFGKYLLPDVEDHPTHRPSLLGGSTISAPKGCQPGNTNTQEGIEHS